MSKAKWEHLVRNVPNTEENRKFIKDVNKMSKESDSYYKLFIKYRKPKKGFNSFIELIKFLLQHIIITTMC